MKIHELKATKKHSPKRVGRGISAGQGKTAGRGTKGQNARSGGGVRLGFEGGQNPLMQRLPKQRGFKSHRPKAQIVYTDQLNNLKGATVTLDSLLEAKLIRTNSDPVKVLKRGEVTKKLTVSVPSLSQGAREVIEKAGGTVKLEASKPTAKTPKTE